MPADFAARNPKHVAVHAADLVIDAPARTAGAAARNPFRTGLGLGSAQTVPRFCGGEPRNSN